MKKKLGFIIISFLTIILHVNDMSAENHIIKVRVTHFPPQYYQDDDGNWTGIDVELARALITEAGFTPEFFPQPWARGLESLRNGDVHIVPLLDINEERKEFALWIGPMRRASVSLIVKEGDESLPIQSLDDMIIVSKKQGKKFGHQKGIFWSEEFNGRLEHDPEFAACFETITRVELNIRKTLEGRILWFFENKNSLEYLIQHDMNYAGLVVHPFILDSRSTFFGISKKGVDAKTLIQLFEAYDTLTLDGTLQRIRDEWNY